MNLAPVLEREEYVEQAYFFRTFRERLSENLASQEILERLPEEILATTRLPYAIQFLTSELKHAGVLGPALQKLPHYFTPFQAFVVRNSEEEGQRFSMEAALQVLEAEARYRSEKPTPAGLFVYQFEVISRNRLGYEEGLKCMAQDAFYDAAWREYLVTVRRSVGEIDFGDLVYVRSELHAEELKKQDPKRRLPPTLFSSTEGKIAKASHGRDPLYLFAALQRQLGYPAVPRRSPRDDPEVKLLAVQAKLTELEKRLRMLEGELRGRADVVQMLGKPEMLKED